MSTPPWLQAQRSQQQQQQHKPHPLIFRSATPPPGRPRSAAAANSPPRGRHVIPRSHSVLHGRPPSAPRITSAASPLPLDHHRQPIVGHSQADSDALEHQQGSTGVGNQVHVDYSAIQRIADGVERMVRSWTSENSCRAQVYAKAYDSLNAAVARGKDQAAAHHQHHPPEEPVNSTSSTQPSPFKFNLHSDVSAVHNLQSPADPNMVEMAPCIFDMQHRNGDCNFIDDEEHISSAHQQVQDSGLHGGLTSSSGGHGAGGYNVAKLSMGAHYAAAGLAAGRNPPLMENGELLYTECPPYPFGQDALKKLKTGSNMYVHNRTHNYPIGLGLINEADEADTKSGGSIPTLASRYSHSQLNNMQVDYDPRELQARIRGGAPGEVAEAGVALHLQQQYQRSNQLQSTPLIRSDIINSSSLIKSTFRSRSPSLRLGTFSNSNANNSLEVYHEGSKIERRVDEKYEAKVRELEISLLECATEYEVQLVEMKMKMLQMKSEFRQKTAPEENKLALCKPLQSVAQDAQISSKPNRQNASPEVLLDQSMEPVNSKRRAHKEKYSENVPPTKPRLLSKKEQELLNSQLREKELSGQIHELQTTVQRGRVTQMEPKKLLSLLLALSEWLQSVKAGVLNDNPNVHRKAYQNVHALAHLRMNLEEPQNANRTSNTQSPRLENLAIIVNKEIKTLQEILGKLTPHRRRSKC